MFNRPAPKTPLVQGRKVFFSWVRGFFYSSLLLAPLIFFSFFPLSADTFNLSQSSPLIPMAKKATLPFYVYGDESGQLSQFIPSGYIGDLSSLSTLTSAYDESAPASTGRMGHTSLRIAYKAQGKKGWAGIYWLSPANNWGTIKGAGFDLRKAKKLTFWLRGEKGGERISQIKMGGVNGPYPDSDTASLGPLTLTKEWQQYTIELQGKDLRHIIGGFMFLIRQADNPRGATFYMDEIVYRGSPKDEVELVATTSDENVPSTVFAGAGPADASRFARPESPASGPGSPGWEKIRLGDIGGATEDESDSESSLHKLKQGQAKTGETVWKISKIKLSADDIPTPGRWLKYKKGSHAK